MFGIEIVFKDGKKDWIDPVSNDPQEKDGVLTVENSAHSYQYPMSDVARYFKYELCNKCGNDIRTHNCSEA